MARTITSAQTSTSIDGTFDPGADADVHTFAVQPDGRILLGGAFTTLGGQKRERIARLNRDGTLDETFNPGASHYVNSLSVQADGRILVGGSFSTLTGQPRGYIARMNGLGSPDLLFNPGANARVRSIALQPNGNLILGGDFTQLAGQPRERLGRLYLPNPPTESLSYQDSTITWRRGGGSPEVWRATFDVSEDGLNWAPLGEAIRIPGAWQLGDTPLPAGATLRARGFVATGGNAAGSWFSESILRLPVARSHGVLVAWGSHEFGESTPPPSASNVTAVAAAVGGRTSLAVGPDGRVIAWGANWAGQADVPADLTDVIAVAASEYHSLALRADGTVTAWGDSYMEVTNVPSALRDVIAISAGNSHAMALKQDGTVVGWGLLLSPNPFPSFAKGLTNVVAIAAGYTHNVALRSDGSVVTSRDSRPLPASNVVAIAAGGSDCTFTLDVDGRIEVWGDHCGAEARIPADLTGAIGMAIGVDFGVAIKADGTAVAWGDGGSQAITLPPSATNLISIAAGFDHVLAIMGEGASDLDLQVKGRGLSPDAFQVSVQTRSGRVYMLEHSDSIGESEWTGLPLVAGTGAQRVLQDPKPASKQRFYRVRSW